MSEVHDQGPSFSSALKMFQQMEKTEVEKQVPQQSTSVSGHGHNITKGAKDGTGSNRMKEIAGSGENSALKPRQPKMGKGMQRRMEVYNKQHKEGGVAGTSRPGAGKLQSGIRPNRPTAPGKQGNLGVKDHTVRLSHIMSKIEAVADNRLPQASDPTGASIPPVTEPPGPVSPAAIADEETPVTEDKMTKLESQPTITDKKTPVTEDKMPSGLEESAEKISGLSKQNKKERRRFNTRGNTREAMRKADNHLGQAHEALGNGNSARKHLFKAEKQLAQAIHSSKPQYHPMFKKQIADIRKVRIEIETFSGIKRVGVTASDPKGAAATGGRITAEDNKKLLFVATEMLTTETTFKTKINLLLSGLKSDPKLAKEFKEEIDILKELVKANSEFHAELEKAIGKEGVDAKGLDDLFKSPKFKNYMKPMGNYTNNYDTTLKKLASSSPELAKAIKKVENDNSDAWKSLKLRALFILPVQRGPRYKLLTREMQKKVPEKDPNYKHFEHVSAKAKKAIDTLDESKGKYDAKIAMEEVKSALDGLSSGKKIAVVDGKLTVKNKGITPKTRKTIKPKGAEMLLGKLNIAKGAGMPVKDELIKLAQRDSFIKVLNGNPKLKVQFNDLLTGTYREILKSDIADTKALLAEQKTAQKAMTREQGISDAQAGINTTEDRLRNLEGFKAFFEEKGADYILELIRENPQVEKSKNEPLLDQITISTDGFDTTVKEAGAAIDKFEKSANALVDNLPLNEDQKEAYQAKIGQIRKDSEDAIQEFLPRRDILLEVGLFKTFQSQMDSKENEDKDPKDIDIPKKELPSAMSMLGGVGGSPRKLSDSFMPDFIADIHKNVFLKADFSKKLPHVNPQPGGEQLQPAETKANIAAFKQMLMDKGVPEDETETKAKELGEKYSEVVNYYKHRGTKGAHFMGSAGELTNLLKEAKLFG